MVRMEKVDPSVLKGVYKPIKWGEVIEQFEREGHDIVKINESGRERNSLQVGLSSAIKRAGKSGTLVCKIIDRNCYLLRKELLGNGR